jgi:hypothetical protein
MIPNLDGAPDLAARVKRAQRVYLGVWLVVGVLAIGSTLVSIASITSLIGHDSLVHDLGQLGMVLSAGMVFVNAAYGMAIYGWRSRFAHPGR